jgi:hypothetical protein
MAYGQASSLPLVLTVHAILKIFVLYRRSHRHVISRHRPPFLLSPLAQRQRFAHSDERDRRRRPTIRMPSRSRPALESTEAVHSIGRRHCIGSSVCALHLRRVRRLYLPKALNFTQNSIKSNGLAPQYIHSFVRSTHGHAVVSTTAGLMDSTGL